MENGDQERRKHTRYAASEDKFVSCRKRTGQVIDISRGGMAIHIIDNSESFSEGWETTYFCRKTSTGINKLPLKVVQKEDKKLPPFGFIPTQIVRVKFDNPNTMQQEQIEQQISEVILRFESQTA